MKSFVPILFVILLIISCKPAVEEKKVEPKSLIALVQKDGKFGYINPAGEYLIKPSYKEALPFSNGLAAVDVNGKKSKGMEDVLGGRYAVINVKNIQVFDAATFKNPPHFYNNFAVVQTSRRKKGMLGKDGKLLVKEYHTLGDFSEGLTLASKKRKQLGYMDTTARFRIELEEEDGFYGSFYDGLACVLAKEKYGFIDTTGSFVIKPTLAIPSDFIEGRAAFLYKGKYGFIDKSGETMVNPEYEEAADFSSGLCAVQQNGKWGFIDKMGRVVVDFEYELVGDFNNGLAPVRVDDRMGYINRKGKLVIAPQYAKAHGFYNGYGIIEVAGLLGFIDTEGKVVVAPQYTAVSRFLDANRSNSRYESILVKNKENED